MTQPPDPLDIETAAELLRTLGHVTRLELIRALQGEERSVSDIEAATGVGQPALSQQLAVLRKADLVLTRRAAKQVFYRLNRDRFAMLTSMLNVLGNAAPPSDAQSGDIPATSGAAVFARVG
ncbi:ArsR/SmtB family transcription factor [Sphingosinithalassobacter portus]|uniref:ArsR/SmtB family transcription factor n=1 Tax=Stakelama portus TaxID=2676234 RepID=UPI000D6E9C49|nr:metalloregulator ArsR/SmtB family transcription factor [Sphingosinithalassobacter portus]